MGTRIIALLNQKGGVGKTTTCVSLGAALARRGHRVLLVDMDPQSNMTVHLGADFRQIRRSTYSLLLGEHPLGSAVLATRDPNLRYVPATLALANAEIQLASAVGRELLLREAIEVWLEDDTAGEPSPRADFVFIDCPPSLGILTMNALCAANEVLLPIQAEFFALQGIAGILESLKAVQRLNRGLQLSMVVPCMVDKRKTLAREVMEEVDKYFGRLVTKTRIRNNVKLAEAPSHGMTIYEYDPSSNGAKDYMSLAREVLGESPDADDDADGSAGPAAATAAATAEMPSVSAAAAATAAVAAVAEVVASAPSVEPEPAPESVPDAAPAAAPTGDATAAPSGDATAAPGGAATVAPSGDADAAPSGDATACDSACDDAARAETECAEAVATECDDESCMETATCTVEMFTTRAAQAEPAAAAASEASPVEPAPCEPGCCEGECATDDVAAADACCAGACDTSECAPEATGPAGCTTESCGTVACCAPTGGEALPAAEASACCEGDATGCDAASESSCDGASAAASDDPQPCAEPTPAGPDVSGGPGEPGWRPGTTVTGPQA